jgi:hypothetical protein
MRRTILGALTVAALLVPSLAHADMNVTNPTRSAVGMPGPASFPSQSFGLQEWSRGNGQNYRDNGDVTGPGRRARVDTASKGPMDDLHPGNPHSDDVPASAHPHPVR